MKRALLENWGDIASRYKVLVANELNFCLEL